MSAVRRATRVVPDVGSPGKWVAQYFDAGVRQWFDMGDPRDTEEEARALLTRE
jgi:thiamine pyrophosphate-dependent acetolactate synthase large subunit-like protein